MINIIKKNVDDIYDEIYTAQINIIVESGVFLNDFNIGRIWVGNYMEACFNNNYGFSHGDGGDEKLSIGNDSFLRKKKKTPLILLNS